MNLREPKDFGWAEADIQAGEPGGWSLEGGEDAYFEHLSNYHKRLKLIEAFKQERMKLHAKGWSYLNLDIAIDYLETGKTTHSSKAWPILEEIDDHFDELCEEYGIMLPVSEDLIGANGTGRTVKLKFELTPDLLVFLNSFAEIEQTDEGVSYKVNVTFTKRKEDDFLLTMPMRIRSSVEDEE